MPSKTILKLLPVLLFSGCYALQGQQSIAVELDAAHSRNLPANFFGANSGYQRNSFNWADPAFQSALGKLTFVNTLRFPAGTLANYWDWKSGTLLLNYDDGFGPAKNAYPSPLREFATELAITHATPLFVLNMLTDPTCVPPAGGYCEYTPTSPNLQYQLEMLRAARAMGLDLQYLELGNEYYIGNTVGYKPVYPDPAGSGEPLAAVVYGRLASKWIAAIKHEYPRAKISAVGVHLDGSPRTDPRRLHWLSGLFDPAANSAAVGGNGQAALQGADAVTLHVYPAANLPAGTAIDASSARDLFAEPFKLWAAVKANDLPLIPPNVDIWFTEYNLAGREVPSHGTWAHGLFMATLTLLFLEEDRVQMAVHHDVVDNALHGDLYFSTSAFSKLGNWAGPAKPPATALWGASATADALNVVGTAAAGASHAQRLTFEGVPQISDRRKTATYPALYGWNFTGGPNRRLVMVNLGDKPLPASLGAVGAGGSYHQLFGDPGTLITGGLEGSPSNLSEKNGSWTGGAALELPAFSITMVETSGR